MKSNFFKMFSANPFSAIKSTLAPENVQGILNEGTDVQIGYRIKSSNGKLEYHGCVKSSLIKEDMELIESYTLRLSQEGLYLKANRKEIKIPVKLIWGFLSIIMSVVDVCEKISDILGGFEIRLQSQLEKFAREFKSTVTVDGKSLNDIQDSQRDVLSISVVRHGVECVQFRMDAHSDLHTILEHVLEENCMEHGWYTIRIDGVKRLRYLYKK